MSAKFFHHKFLQKLKNHLTAHLKSNSIHPYKPNYLLNSIIHTPIHTKRSVRINMPPSHILPVSNPASPQSSSSSSSSPPMFKNGAASSATMLIRSEDDSTAGTTRIFMPPDDDDDDKRRIERKPFIPRASSYTNAAVKSDSHQQKRRRRVSSDNSLLNYSDGQQHSVQEDVQAAAYDTCLITRLSLTLLRYLGVGYKWITRFLALGCYAFLLFPGFVQVGYSYFFSKQIRRGIVYGDQPRNRLDLYLPKNIDGPKPVVAFVTGGAWIIGYKAWGSLLGLQLSERDIIVACIDYRIYLMGQSAGAHIASCALLEQAIKEASGAKTSWSVSQIKAYFGLSGGYNFLNLVDHFHTRGLYRSIFLSIMEGEESLQRYSPELLVQDPNVRNAVPLLPPIILFHGTADYSIPSDASKSFAETLRSLGVQAESILYEGKTHTDLFLQDPMRGGRDEMFEDLVAMIHAGDSEALAKDATASPRRRLVPECMLKLARKVSPF
ncbi:hypothetical protein BUALT_Bualt05G0134300 [Buddleja alternifolia]|uniref:protein-S-isoprenylcysteine alpha-carbonyl methylesterase n=1 Tax=Buddleja alternifolia TaxID=168488 RepID=A0AAV6XUM9_9LAMI|nr:hypothetical protein BUALT_Bualt05G0134300 [Buddleja alternifolia]